MAGTTTVGLTAVPADSGGTRLQLRDGHRFASQPAPAFTDLMVAAFLVLVGLVAVWRVFERSVSTTDTIVGIASLTVLVALHIWWFGHPGRNRPSPGLAMVILAETLLVYLPFTIFPWWLGLPGILAGTMLLVCPPRTGLPLFALVGLSIWPLRLNDVNGATATALFGVITTLMTGLAVFGLTRLTYLVHGLHAARGDLARLAVAEERLNFATDLQARLGIRLSEIVARIERIRRRITDRPDARVHDDLTEVLQVSRTALADVRSVARGYRRLSLDVELADAKSMLASADIDVQVEQRVPGELSEQVATVLAVVLREAVTNVLREGNVRRCEVRLERSGEHVTLEVATDTGDTGEGRDRAGLDATSSIADQVRDIGGEFSAGVGSDGRYRVRATVPRGNQPNRPEARAWQVPVVSRRLSNSVVAAVMLGFAGIILADAVIDLHDHRQAALGTLYLAIILGLQVGYFARPTSQLRPGISVAALLVQGFFAYLPVVHYGGYWLTMLGFVAANALLVLRPAVSVPISVGVLASLGWFYTLEDPRTLYMIGEVIWACATVTLVYGLTRLVQLVAELNAAQSALARMAVAEERLRFARDVHDLLGLSLSAVTLKAELANRLLDIRPAAAREQLAEIITLSRKAIGDVRSVARGYQDFNLDDELRLARSVLASAEIDVRIHGYDFTIPEPLASVLATVVREGVTNVLRHSKAEHCEISVQRTDGTVQLDIVNDGLTRERTDGSDDNGGDGIANLEHRLKSVAGRLDAGVSPEGGYRLRAAAPLRG